MFSFYSPYFISFDSSYLYFHFLESLFVARVGYCRESLSHVARVCVARVTWRESCGWSLCRVAWVEACCLAEILEVVRSAVMML